jgi:acylphosphatase
MSDENQRFHALILGFVQGVNFRYYTTQTARRIGVTGWVRNRADSTVEVVAEGTRPQLDELLEFLSHGPPSARVDQVQTKWEDPTGEYTNFEVATWSG